MCSNLFLPNDWMGSQMLGLVEDCATATLNGQTTIHRIDFLVLVLDMTPDWCMHGMRRAVSQYKDCTWIGIDQKPFGEIARELCCVVDGRSLNREC